MSGRPTRLTRLVDLARLREEHARHALAAARNVERARDGEARASEVALRHVAPGHHAAFRFDTALHALGRAALTRAEDEARRASEAAEAHLATWRDSHQHLSTLERLDERLQQAIVAAGRRAEQRQTDELATTRARVSP